MSITCVVVEKDKSKVFQKTYSKEKFNAFVQSFENLNVAYGVDGDEGDLLFLGSKERNVPPTLMYGFVNKNKVCGSLYNDTIIIVNQIDGKQKNGYYSLSPSQIRYFRNVYKKNMEQNKKI